MIKLFRNTLDALEVTFRKLELKVPAPQKITCVDGYNYRFVEKTIHQAIIQKLARTLSGLHATLLLHQHGYLQEQGVLQRTLDECFKDIVFLSCGIVKHDITKLHQRYLSAFYEEEFEPGSDPVAAPQNRPMIPRKKIRAYIARMDGVSLDPSRGIEVYRTVSKIYSGYVHGASPHIMDMVAGSPPKFHVSGSVSSTLIKDHLEDLWNYFYRGILSFIWAAKAFGDERLVKATLDQIDRFESISGTNIGAKARGET